MEEVWVEAESITNRGSSRCKDLEVRRRKTHSNSGEQCTRSSKGKGEGGKVRWKHHRGQTI